MRKCQKKEEMLRLRISNDDKKAIMAEAEKTNLTMSDYVREIIFDRIRSKDINGSKR